MQFHKKYIDLLGVTKYSSELFNQLGADLGAIFRENLGAIFRDHLELYFVRF